MAKTQQDNQTVTRADWMEEPKHYDNSKGSILPIL
jgi:hypothetical protein